MPKHAFLFVLLYFSQLEPFLFWLDLMDQRYQPAKKSLASLSFIMMLTEIDSSLAIMQECQSFCCLTKWLGVISPILSEGFCSLAIV